MMIDHSECSPVCVFTFQKLNCSRPMSFEYNYSPQREIYICKYNVIFYTKVAGFCTTGWISEHDHNMIFTPNVTKINVGEELHISCRPGYILRGASTLTCDLVHGFIIPGMMFTCGGKLSFCWEKASSYILGTILFLLYYYAFCAMSLIIPIFGLFA